MDPNFQYALQQQVMQQNAQQPPEVQHEPEEEENDQWDSKQNQGNILPIWGNPRTMNLNHLILTNIQNSPYFKVKLNDLKTYHEVVDEIYYKVDHMEPWEKGSRKTAGQTGMCGGVRGVGAGGIVSSCFCNLFKLFTLKLTKNQLRHMLNHRDSPYIRGIGFMYIRFCQPPEDLYSWYEPYFEDTEEIDVKAGGGFNITIGTMVKMFLNKLEWFATLFPRIPVPIQKTINEQLREYQQYQHEQNQQEEETAAPRELSRARSADKARSSRARNTSKHRDRGSSARRRSTSRDQRISRERRDRKHRSRSRDRKRRSRSHDRGSRRRSHERERDHHKSSRKRSRSRDRKHRSRSRDRRDERSSKKSHRR